MILVLCDVIIWALLVRGVFLMSLGKCFLCGREFRDKNLDDIYIKENCDYKCWFDISMDEKIKLVFEYEEKNDCSFRKLSKSSKIICLFVALIFLMISIVVVIGVTFAYYSVIYNDVGVFVLLCLVGLIGIICGIAIITFLNKRAKRSEKDKLV